MKILGLLVLVIVGIVGFLKLRNVETPREKAIREERVTLAMTQDEVRRSRGYPIVSKPQSNGTEVWEYGDGTLVTFSGGKVIDSQKHEIPQPLAAVAGRKVSWDPATKRYVEHADKVSVRQSVGGGGGAGPIGARPTPQASAGAEARKQFGWKDGGTALDEPPKR